jgi:hypothetical protein
MNSRLFGALTAMAFLWVGKYSKVQISSLSRRLTSWQAVKYHCTSLEACFPESIRYTYPKELSLLFSRHLTSQQDIGGTDRYVWFVIGYLIPNAALCPFVGALSDMFGRRNVAVVGQLALIVGPVITSTAKTMNIAICEYMEFHQPTSAIR